MNMKLALNVDAVTHRTRVLIDVELECGCVITYEFEYEAASPSTGGVPLDNGFPSAVKLESGGWWVSTLLHPGEFTEQCEKAESECVGLIFGTNAKRDGYELALRHVAKLVPSQKG